MARRKPQNSGQKPATSGTGFVRIISGLWRGRKLPVKNVEGLRPTTDRVKETVFNWLAGDLHQANCLDLFAGSGGLGLEALSRQAASVTLLELDRGAAAQIQQNLAALGATNAKVVNTDALAFLAKPGTPFDVVFIDPPFRKELLDDVIGKLESNNWLAANAIVYIEAEKELGDIDTPASWSMLKEKTAGQVCFRLYEREEK